MNQFDRLCDSVTRTQPAGPEDHLVDVSITPSSQPCLNSEINDKCMVTAPCIDTAALDRAMRQFNGILFWGRRQGLDIGWAPLLVEAYQGEIAQEYHRQREAAGLRATTPAT
jgi:hypothetical protein